MKQKKMQKLFDPLLKSEQYYYLEYIQSEMELKLHESKIKNPNIDYSDAVKKIKLIQNVKHFIYEMWEEGYVLLNRSMMLERKIIDLDLENRSLKKENDCLKENISL